MNIHLPTLEATATLGRTLAEIFLAHAALRTMLMRGGLGSGKTTLVSAIVRCLPGGNTAEVCSPSFTICNMYGTKPEVGHCDLYRAGAITDEVWDLLEDPACLKMIEWAEYLPGAALPKDYMDIHMQSCNTGKLVAVDVAGRYKTTVFAALESVFFSDKRIG